MSHVNPFAGRKCGLRHGLVSLLRLLIVLEGKDLIFLLDSVVSVAGYV